MVRGQRGVSSLSLGCGPACAKVGWPYKCTVWRAMALKIGAHSCNNATPFWLMLVWLNTTPCYPLPGDGSRSGDINTTMTCCCCSSYFFCICTCPGDISTTMTMRWLLLCFFFFCICTRRAPTTNDNHHHVVRVTMPKNNNDANM